MFATEINDTIDVETDIADATIDNPVVLEFGETVRQIQPLRRFIKQYGSDEVIRDYQNSLDELNHLTYLKQKTPPTKAQMLENEIETQKITYGGPADSLTSQLGFHALLQQFKDSALSKVTEGTARVAEPDRETTIRNIGTKGIGEAIQNVWTTYRYSI